MLRIHKTLSLQDKIDILDKIKTSTEAEEEVEIDEIDDEFEVRCYDENVNEEDIFEEIISSRKNDEN